MEKPIPAIFHITFFKLRAKYKKGKEISCSHTFY